MDENSIVLRKVIAVLDELDIPYFVGGSVASGAWGIPRSTHDVDLVVRMTLATDIDGIVSRLQDEFYVDGELIRDAITHQGSFNLLYLLTMIKADVFIAPTTPWREQAWERRRLRPVGVEDGPDAPRLYFASAEDMVLQKLLWYRMAGEQSERQWGDVQGILRVQSALIDLDYLRHWAPEPGVADLLERALSDVGLT